MIDAPPSPDLSDAIAAGAPLGDILDGADVGAVVDLPGDAERGRAAAAALERLANLGARIAAATSDADRVTLRAEVLGGPLRRGLMYAAALRADELEAALLTFGSPRGSGAIATRLRTHALRDARDLASRDAERRRDDAQRREAKIGAQPLARVLASVLGRHVLPPGLVCPAGYRVRPDGVYLVREVDGVMELGARIATAPVVLTGLLADVETDALSLRVDGLVPGVGWRSQVVPATFLASAREIVAGAAWGLPVDSTTASDLVRYLTAFRSANAEALPVARVASRMGWHAGADGTLGYLWGRRWIGVSGVVEEEAPVQLHAPDGVGDVADGLRARGSLADWIGGVWGRVHGHPAAVLGVWAALVPPLYRALEGESAPNWVMEWVGGGTSTGKTVCWSVARSVWGAEWGRSWKATGVSLEVLAGLCDGLPLPIDDTREGKPKVLESAVYDYVSGRSKGRSNPGIGLRQERTWRGVMLSTGEEPLASYSHGSGGDRARTVTLRGLPLRGATAEDVAGIEAGVADSCGTLGPAVVGWLVAHQDEWPRLRERYRHLHRWAVDRFLAAGGGTVAQRGGAYLALVQLAREVAEGPGVALPAPPDGCDPLGLMIASILESAVDANPAHRALRALLSWASSHQARFVGRHQSQRGDPVEPSAGWAGVWRAGDDWDVLAILPTVLQEVLAGWGYDADTMMGTWREMGWTRPAEAGHRHPKVRAPLTSSAPQSWRCCVVLRDGFRAVGALVEEEE